MTKKEYFYDELKRRAASLHLNPERDNESSRHDLLIYPILTSEFGLAWNPLDLISQSNITVPKEIENSHIFRGAVPRIRKPDILIVPNALIKNVAVIEEKNKQDSLKSLANHRLQLNEYQALYECTWGVLTDGERWIIKRNFDTIHEFSSIDELRKKIIDFRNCIGSKEIMYRYDQHNTFDFIIISPYQNISNSIFSEFENIPVTVCGVYNGIITEDGSGFETFKNLRSALLEFPDLHPKLNTKRFTWAMGDKKKEMRFETWKAYKVFSI